MQPLSTDDGESLQVEVLGSGPPLVILHGWTASHRDWMYTARSLGDLATSYCWDARGHNLKPRSTDTPVTLARMADDLHCLIQRFGLRRPVVLGHSMGALTAWEYLARHGQNALAGLVIVDQSPRLLTDERWKLGLYGDYGARRAAEFSSRLRENFAESVLELQATGRDQRGREACLQNADVVRLLGDYLGTMDRDAMIECWDSLVQADFRTLLPQIRIPTLLLFGGSSRFYGADVAHYVQARIPGSTLKLYPQADHCPHLSARERFVDDVRQLLRRCQPCKVTR